jgi:hypothetical protein
VADVDRLVQINKLARLPQPVQELAEILFHGVSSGRWGQGAKLPGGGGLRQSFRCVGVAHLTCHYLPSLHLFGYAP